MNILRYLPRPSRWAPAAGGSYAVKWAAMFIVIGLVAGAGSIVFHLLTQLGSHYLLDFLAGYRPPQPAGEEQIFGQTATSFSRWMLLILPAAGGLLSGLLVFKFAPEAAGHGEDGAIDAYHTKGGFIRGRVPIVKTFASVLTLTSGGSGGREGPIAQIGAGFGSFLGTKLGVSDRQRRIMLAAGMGAGVGSIFRSPMAGALFATEVLYRDTDMESEVLIPAVISSVVAYCVFCLAMGWGSLFSAPYLKFQNPVELGPYLVLAVVVVAAAALFVKAYYFVHYLFGQFSIPNFAKPALGGLCTGIIGFFLPQTLAFGYGYVQMVLNGAASITIPFLLLLAFGKLLTTSFSIGSGGSGGVFGPSIVIGGALGGAVGIIFDTLMPGVISSPAAFAIVGMAGFFTAVSKTPISTIIFVSEMTGSYYLLLPSLLVSAVAFMLSRRFTLYVKQPKNILASPAHAGDFFVDILQAIKVKDLMGQVRHVPVIPETMPFSEFKKFFSRTKQHYFPVVDHENRLTGIFSSTDIREVLFEEGVEPLVIMRDIAIPDIITTHPEEDLNAVLMKFTTKNLDSIPVVETNDPKTLLGMLRRREVIAYYNQQVNLRKRNGSRTAA
ncbi:MAG: chloride channel protein [Deltaproteobacteria bacterium]|nr:chloride channel protein [Deltaproteobacteria bacterium]